MSSFRRRTAVQPIQGTRPSPYNAAPLLSTGLSSIDDLLGGGLPLSTSLLIEADSPTSYADLLLRYWIAQGLECGQEVLVAASGLDGGPEGIVEALMEVDGGRPAETNGLSKEDAAEDEEERKQEEALQEKMKIAFRYEGMRQHQTTVDPSRNTSTNDSGTYCSIFDLTMPRQLSATHRQLIHLVDIDDLSGGSRGPYDALYSRIESLVQDGGFFSPSSPSSPLVVRLSHAADGVLRLTSFASSPLHALTFPRHAGLLSFPKLPLLPPGSLVPPGSKLSVLRGLGGGGEGRDNLVGFRVKRRRFVVEVVSDDPVAGTGEDEEREKRRKRVEEANRKEREMAQGRSGTEVLLGLGDRVAQVRIGDEVEAPRRAVQVVAAEPAGATVTADPLKRKGVRMGGVQFAQEDNAAPPPRERKKVSVARMVHEQPDLLDF
ncbi:hypothetical protein Rhopal_002559-T1 [Rhodotorula paludigena]|uniref:Elongator complex protein 4 n=1 Tax=Rhodotorula paludigena TaxID=86838 RepID=A0AAV5GKK9_9BASI|nr:hypothetical protein Rhopal_002559-T1 [Rhodotorula paludigena]